MEAAYDGILLGAGHNALVLQAYLGRSGLRTLSLDRAEAPGGGLTTVPNSRAPGFLHNTHSFFHRAITEMPWFRDLELPRHGVRYVEPELNVVMILRDGRVLEWWTDLERTVESFSAFSKTDAASLKRWTEEFTPVLETLLIPESRSPPLPPAERASLLQRTPEGRRLLEVATRSPLEFVLDEFEHDAIRAGLLFFNGLREVDLRLKGFGHSIPALLASSHKAQMCVGGARALADGLIADIREHGGDVRCGVEVARILMDGQRATGVELSTGEKIAARRLVASGLNPQQTFLDLLPEGAVESGVRRQAERFRYNLLAPLFSLNLALEEPPRYTATETHPEIDDAFMVIIGLESVGQFREIVAAHEAGGIPRTVAWGACPTRFDPSQAPAGKHTAFMWEKLPFALGGDAGNWRTAGEEHARELLNVWTEFAPNLAEPGVIVDRFHGTPLQTQERFPNMREGDLLIGAFAGGQVGYHRPFPGAGTYRTPVPGLYLCGGSTHPGGNITGLCGYNAARVIAADLGLDTWWKPVDVRDAWRAG